MQDYVARALVVDDDPALRMLCRVNLQIEGFAVREAATVAEADAALAADKASERVRRANAARKRRKHAEPGAAADSGA